MSGFSSGTWTVIRFNPRLYYVSDYWGVKSRIAFRLRSLLTLSCSSNPRLYYVFDYWGVKSRIAFRGGPWGRELGLQRLGTTLEVPNRANGCCHRDSLPNVRLRRGARARWRRSRSPKEALLKGRGRTEWKRVRRRRGNWIYLTKKTAIVLLAEWNDHPDASDPVARWPRP